MSFQLITAGHAWLEIQGHEPRLLQQGSLTLLPHGAPHSFKSALDCETADLFDIPVESITDLYEPMRFGGGGEITRVMHGLVSLDKAAGNRLLAQLPALLQFGSLHCDDVDWLQSTLRLIAREASALRPGGEAVITKLADILIIQALRSWLSSAPEAHEGWLAALRDEQVGRAMNSMHRSPGKPWTLALLAESVHMSRSAFSARFTSLVGMSAMRYLAQWRMQVAREHIQNSSESLALVAERFGYQSEAAFSRAFKRDTGVSPGAFRRTDSRD